MKFPITRKFLANMLVQCEPHELLEWAASVIDDDDIELSEKFFEDYEQNQDHSLILDVLYQIDATYPHIDQDFTDYYVKLLK